MAAVTASPTANHTRHISSIPLLLPSINGSTKCSSKENSSRTSSSRTTKTTISASGSGAAAVASVRFLSSTGSSQRSGHSCHGTTVLPSPRSTGLSGVSVTAGGSGRMSARDRDPVLLHASSRNNSYRLIQPPNYQQQRDQALALKEMMMQSQQSSSAQSTAFSVPNTARESVAEGRAEADDAGIVTTCSSSLIPLLLPKIVEVDPNDSFTLGNHHHPSTKHTEHSAVQ